MGRSGRTVEKSQGGIEAARRERGKGSGSGVARGARIGNLTEKGKRAGLRGDPDPFVDRGLRVGTLIGQVEDEVHIVLQPLDRRFVAHPRQARRVHLLLSPDERGEANDQELDPGVRSPSHGVFVPHDQNIAARPRRVKRAPAGRKFPLDSVGSLSYTPGVSKLRRLREQKGYSIRGLAKAARLDWMTVWRVETDRRQPTVATLKKLARALKVEVADLL